MNSASLCSLAGQYDYPIPPRFLAPIDSLKIPALTSFTCVFEPILSKSVYSVYSPVCFSVQTFRQLILRCITHLDAGPLANFYLYVGHMADLFKSCGWCNHTLQKIWNIYSQKWNCAALLPLSICVSVSNLYIPMISPRQTDPGNIKIAHSYINVEIGRQNIIIMF